MPRYLLEASYIGEGAKGLLKEGGSKRRAAVEEAARAIGAKMEAFYFILGDPDVIIIVDAPDNISATALSMVINASGAVRLKTDILLTAEEVDKAALKAPAYRAPGRKVSIQPKNSHRLNRGYDAVIGRPSIRKVPECLFQKHHSLAMMFCRWLYSAVVPPKIAE